MGSVRGSRAVCATLESLGLGPVFCLPGTEIVELLDALRASPVGTVVATSELGAAFMALGSARTSGRAGLVAAIPGPGLAYTLPALAEARYDSVPLVVLTGEADPAAPFDVGDAAHVFAKDVIEPTAADALVASVRHAHDVAVTGEPGPVVVRLAPALLRAEVPAPEDGVESLHLPAGALVGEAAERIAKAARPLLYVGQGGADAAAEVRLLAERVGAAVLTTTSGRGVLPETHRLSLAFDSPGHGADEVNALVAEADVVVLLGCGLNPNGTLGGRLRFDPSRVIHVDASPAALARGGADLQIAADVEVFVSGILASLPDGPRAGWGDDELSRRRARMLASAGGGRRTEPHVSGSATGAPADFFASLRRVLPHDGILALDSGLHQQLARRHFPVLAPRTLLVPADFQSMGYAIPAAIGAKIANPDRAVVALLGDGGLAMTGLELVTAARAGIALTVVVFNDGFLNLIRLQQLLRFGRTHAVTTSAPDVRGLASAVGATYARVLDSAEDVLADSIAADELRLVEVAVQDTPWLRRLRAVGALRRTVRRASSSFGR